MARTAMARTESILLVDDLPDNLQVLSQILIPEGYRVRAVTSGALALRTIAAERPELILADIKMPGMDGFELCRRLKAEEATRGIPVIFISALGETKDKVQAFQAGGIDYITKPFQAAEVVARVRTHLAVHQLRASLEEANRELEDRVRLRTRELSEHLRSLRATLKISEAAQTAASSQELFARIHEIVSGLLDARNFYIAVFEGKTGQLSFPYFVDEVDPPPPPRKAGNTLTDLVIREGESRLFTREDVLALDASCGISVQGTPPTSWLGVPLKGEEGTFGALVVQSYTEEVRYGVGEVELFQFVATQVAASVLRKRAEEDRAVLQNQLQHAQKMESLGSLAGGVAHDMNNVLAAILAMASVNLELQPEDSRTRHAFATIAEAATRGGKLVQSLLGFARKRPAETTRLDLNAILLEETRLLEHTVLAKVTLKLDLEPALRPIRGDANALTHAIMNLCVNAVDAIEGDGTLTLATRNLEDPWVEVSVQDTGCGMPPDVLERASDPFFTTKGVGKGTGLGLSMVYSTLKAHKGTMEIQSEPGRGTRVVLRFPACEAADAGPREAPEARPARPGRSLHVLLVDDDLLVLKATRDLVETLGHAVTTAMSGEEALEALEGGLVPDAVILDLNMPGMGGAGTLPRVRALRPDLPVLLATGRVDQAALDLVAAHNGVSLLAKPFSYDELRRQLDLEPD